MFSDGIYFPKRQLSAEKNTYNISLGNVVTDEIGCETKKKLSATKDKLNMHLIYVLIPL